jgi:hypothetical protein
LIDTTAIDHLSHDLRKYGFYLYDNKLFPLLTRAMDHAVVKSDRIPQISFIFNNDIYSKIDLKIDPPFTLKELYRQRAQQLRETYDYLILLYSGGADSDNVLQTFLSEGIFLDEVRSYYPVSLAENLDPIPDVNHPLGLLFEYKLALLPKLKKLEKISPKTKINIIDTTEYTKQHYTENFLSDQVHNFRINHQLFLVIKAYQIVETLNEYCEKSNLGRVGVIYGAERVRPFLMNDSLCFKFDEYAFSGVQNSIYLENSRWYSPELFYWTRDCPLIPIKQMHEIKKAMQTNRELYEAIVHPSGYSRTRIVRGRQDTLINNIIYPHWDNTTYQKRIKNEDDFVMNLLVDDKKYTNSLGLRSQSFVSGYVDHILDLKNKAFLDKYKNMIKITRDTRPDIYAINHNNIVQSKTYSVGKI